MIDFIKDADCTKETPVKLGVPDAPIYGKGIKLKPRVDGRTDSEHFKKIYLPELLPLEEYDLIVVLISGGKDSVACYLKLLELGVPKERIEFWHHDIDGGHPSRRMDWKCTQNYVKALADAEGIKLRVSYRVNAIKCFDIEKNDSYKNFSKVMDKANDILKESDKTSLTDDDKALINSMLPDYDKYPSVAKLQAVEIAKSSSKMATLLMLDERYNETVSEALES